MGSHPLVSYKYLCPFAHTLSIALWTEGDCSLRIGISPSHFVTVVETLDASISLCFTIMRYVIFRHEMTFPVFVLQYIMSDHGGTRFLVSATD